MHGRLLGNQFFHSIQTNIRRTSCSHAQVMTHDVFFNDSVIYYIIHINMFVKRRPSAFKTKLMNNIVAMNVVGKVVIGLGQIHITKKRLKLCAYCEQRSTI